MKNAHHKQQKSWTSHLLTVVVSIFIIGVGYLIYLSLANKTDTPLNNQNYVSALKSKVETIDSNYPGIKIITEIANNPDTPFAVQYPQSTHQAFNDEIKTYIQTEKNHYITAINNAKQLKEKITGELNISFETYPHHSGLYSFVLVSNRYVEDEDGVIQIQSFLFNPETGETPTIEDIFEHDVERLTTISTIVQQQLHNDPALQDALLPEQAQEQTKPIWDNYQNVAITVDSLIFYFPENKMAAKTVGPLIVSIPLSEINELLAKKFKAQQDKEDLEDQQTVPQKEAQDTKEEVEKESTEVQSTSPSKRVALTFDDGPDPKVTMQILETLEKYNAKATFFMLGSRVEFYPEIAKNVQAAGHELGNHSWTHPNLNKASVDKVKDEIHNTSAIIEEVTGQKATLFRPPYGAFNDTVKAQSDLPIALWDVDTLDWKHKDPGHLLRSIKQTVKDGSIILMHDIHQSTADGLDAALAYLQNEGYTFVTMSELDE